MDISLNVSIRSPSVLVLGHLILSGRPLNSFNLLDRQHPLAL